MEVDDVRGDVRPTADRPPDRRWVVGVDGSECSRHAALWAVAQSRDRVSEIQLATAWSLPISSSMSPMGPLLTGASFDALEAAARATVDDLVDSIDSPPTTTVTGSIGQGGAAGLLLEAAHDSALLVVGSRGRGGFGRLLLGSTSTQCATHSTAPVAVVPISSPVEPVVSITVAFDGSPNSMAALRWANGFADPGSRIDCVSVWDTTPLAVGSDQFFFPEASDLAEERFEQLVTRTIDPIRRHDVEVRHAFVNGQPRTALAEFAATTDLLVMGARGHGAIGAAILGSVSTWLLHHATRPLVVVPHPDDDRRELDPRASDEDER